MALLKGTYNHFLFYLPPRSGFIPWALSQFFKRITIADNQLEILKDLPSDAILVYTTKFKSYFEYLLYHTRYRTEKAPVPVLGFSYRPWPFQPLFRIWRSLFAHLDWLVQRRQWLDPYANGYWRQELLNGRTAILPLVEKRGFYRRFIKAQTDPLRFLIELQNTTQQPIYLVPHLLFFSKSPTKATLRLRDIFFGTEQRPGMMRRIFTLMQNPGKVFVEISQPLNLQHFLEQSGPSETTTEYQALMLRRKLLLQHNRHRQSITGPIIKSHEEFKEELLSSERLREFMTKYATSRDKTIYEVRKQADDYLDEIAAKYNHFIVNSVARPTEWLLDTMFDGVVLDKEGLQKVKTMSRKGPVIFVPCHKSHIDYLILSAVLYQNNMPAPHIAAGKNLSFWPMGAIFRSVGAFFIRRTFSGAVVYAKVFAEYIFKLLREGFNIEIFIEGGRSRTGKLLMPKLGLITLLLNAFKDRACDDMIFAPVYIGYDQVLEEKAYIEEVSGGEKEPENIAQVIKARRFLNRRYGKIYINFQAPFSLKETLLENDIALEQMNTKEQNALCRNLGWRIINAIEQGSVVTPHALIASAALNCSAPHFNMDELILISDTYIAFLFTQKAQLTDTLMADPLRACEQALENYIQRKIIELPGGEKGMPPESTQYSLPPSKRLQLEYYKNNCIAFFVPAAFTALSILGKDAFQFSSSDLHETYRKLQDFFKYEFSFNLEIGPELKVRKCIKSFIDDAILTPHVTLPDTYHITSVGFRKLKLFARFLLTYFESYWVVLQYYKSTPRNEINAKDRMKKIQSLGKAMHRRRELILNESLSQINFDNGISYFTSNGVRGAENEDKIQLYENTIRNYIQILKQ